MYSGFWRRFGAVVLDGLILGAVNGILKLVFGVKDNAQSFSAISFFIDWVYFAWFESSEHQATLGKKVLGIKVVGESGERITFARASGRYFGKILSTVTLSIGFIMAAFTEKKQALHDMIAKTYVVKSKDIIG